MAKKIEVQIVGDADSFHRAMSKATQSTSKMGNVLGGAFKVGAAAAGAAVLGLGYALKRGIDDFSEGQKVAAQTAAVLKSTGGAANVTAKHVDKLAQSLSQMSGVDDEVIGAGENLMLTFRNIRNEAGKGNDIFDQATKTTLDLSVAMGEDLHTATIQVGKALNDPIKGLTSLSRIGVTFSDSQKKLITHLVDTGHAMEAQKIILGELRKEFGGSAKAAGDTMAGQMNKLKNAFDNAASAIIQQLLPYAVRLAQFAFPLVTKAVQLAAQAVRHAIKWVGQMADHLGILGGKSEGASAKIRNAFDKVKSFFRSEIFPIVRRLQGIFQDAMVAIGKTVAEHGPELRRIFDRVGAAMKAIANVAMPLLRTALVKALPKAIGAGITAIDKITSVIQTLVSWLMAAKSQVDALGDAINSLSGINLNQGLLGALGIDVHKGLLGQVAGVGSGGGGNVGTPRPTANVQRPLQVNLQLDGRVVESVLVQRDKVYRRQNGRGLFA